MSDLLRDVLHDKADAVSVPTVDLDAVVAAGRRSVRRQRALTGLGVAAVLTVTVGTVGTVAVLDQHRASGSQGIPATTASDWSRDLTYAAGSVIHGPHDSLDTGAVVQSYVATDNGFVWTRKSGDVVYSALDGTAPEVIGHTSTDGYYLKSDSAGPLVAWVEFPAGRQPVLVVYDTATRSETLRDSSNTVAGDKAFKDTPHAVYVYAVDAGSVYWHNRAGVVRTDGRSGATTVLGDAQDVSDVAAGTLAYYPAAEIPQGEITVGDSLTTGRPTGRQGNAYLSPGAAYTSFEDADELFVQDNATGADVTPPNPGYAYWVVYHWLDDDTAAAYGIKDLKTLDNPDGPDTTPLDFLVCDFPSGSCTVADTAQVDVNAFSLPVGEHLD